MCMVQALVYLDEGAVGAGIRSAIQSGVVARDDLYVITKVRAHTRTRIISLEAGKAVA